jgi:hypothetical protein
MEEEYCEAELGYKEIELYDTQLRVFPNGDIWRLCKGSSRYGKKGEWISVNMCLNKGYFVVKINGKMIKCHRIIGYAYLGLDITNKKDLIDHKNRIRNDNRVENLQISDHRKNQFNREIKGYSFVKSSGKYQSTIRINGKTKHLGYYDTPEEASAKYHEAKAIFHMI